MESLKSKVLNAKNQEDLVNIILGYAIKNDIDEKELMNDLDETLETLTKNNPDSFNRNSIDKAIEEKVADLQVEEWLFEDLTNDTMNERFLSSKFQFADYHRAVEKYAYLTEEDLDIDDVAELLNNDVQNHSEMFVVMKIYHKQGYDIAENEIFTDTLKNSELELIFFFDNEEDLKEGLKQFEALERAYQESKEKDYLEKLEMYQDFNMSLIVEDIDKHSVDVDSIEELFNVKYENFEGEDLTKFNKFDLDSFFLLFDQKEAFLDYVEANNIKFESLDVEDVRGYFSNLQLNYNQQLRSKARNDIAVYKTTISDTSPLLLELDENQTIVLDFQEVNLFEAQEIVKDDLSKLPLLLEQLDVEEAEIVHNAVFTEVVEANQDMTKAEIEAIKNISLAKILSTGISNRYNEFKESVHDRQETRKAVAQNAKEEYKAYFEANGMKGNKDKDGTKMFRRTPLANTFAKDTTPERLYAGMLDFGKRKPHTNPFYITVNPDDVAKFQNGVYEQMLDSGIFNNNNVQFRPKHLNDLIKGPYLQTSISQENTLDKNQVDRLENEYSDQANNDVDNANVNVEDKQEQEAPVKDAQSESSNDEVVQEVNLLDSPDDELEFDFTPLYLAEPEDLTKYEYTDEDRAEIEVRHNKYKELPAPVKPVEDKPTAKPVKSPEQDAFDQEIADMFNLDDVDFGDDETESGLDLDNDNDLGLDEENFDIDDVPELELDIDEDDLDIDFEEDEIPEIDDDLTIDELQNKAIDDIDFDDFDDDFTQNKKNDKNKKNKP